MLALVQIICDPADSAGAIRFAARAEAHAQVVCRTTPGADDAQLARDVLRGMGKRLDMIDTPRNADTLWDHVNLWVRAGRVSTMLILRAHQLTPARLARLLTKVAPHAILHLLIARSAPSQDMLRTLDQHRARLQSVRQLDDLPAAVGSPNATAPERQPQLPELPHEPFTLFLDACKQRLDDNTLRRVQQTVRSSHRATTRWLQETRPDRVIHAIGYLRQLVTSTPDANEALARVRGAQIALLLDGEMLTNLNAHAFRLEHATQLRHASRLDDHAIALLRRYSSPLLAALGVAALATDLPPQRLTDLSLFHVPEDPTMLLAHPIPPTARVLLRAQRLKRGDSPGDHDAFFTQRRNQAPTNANAIRGALDAMTHQTGLSFRLDGAPERHEDWAARHTLTLQAL